MQDNEKLHAVLVDYVDRSVTGDAPDSDAYLAEHPDLEQQLQKYFATLDLLERLAEADGPDQRRVAHYRLLSRLGRGGAGAVYLARDEKSDRLVAVKVLRGGVLTATPVEVTSFWREAELALRHPNIAAVYEAGEADGVYYLVLQYVPGPSLHRVIEHLRGSRTPRSELGHVDWREVVARLASGDPASPAPAVDRNQSYYAAVASVTADLAEALAYAHDKQVVHRDVKPDNVLLDAEGNAYLTDFGLAKIIGPKGANVSHAVVGTAEYMSPEMAAGSGSDARTDVYSLGATLYALLTLQSPYAGLSHHVQQRIERGPPPRIAQLNPDAPRDLQTIAETAMARDLRQRYASASALAADLRRYLAFQPIRARPVSAMQRLRAWVARNKVRAAVVFLLPIVAVWGARLAWTNAVWNRLVETGIERLKRGDYSNAALALGEALARHDDPQARHAFDDALGTTYLTLSSEPKGADVYVSPLDQKTGESQAARHVGATDASSGELTMGLQPGQYRVVVDAGKSGFGEYHVFVQRGLAGKLDARLLPTAAIVQDMVEVPAGEYWVGEDEASDGEMNLLAKKRQLVATHAFYLDRCEVSNADYARFVAATGYPAPQDWTNGTFPPGSERLPVTWVNWSDATRYAEWAGKRLPTEDEWEIAARGPEGFRFPWGNEYQPSRAHLAPPIPRGTDVIRRERGTPIAVDSATEDRSPFGVLHMTGNVREWVSEPWQPRAEAGKRFPALVPAGQRVLRGSAFQGLTSEREISASNRIPMAPEHPDQWTGFRCAKSRSASLP